MSKTRYPITIKPTRTLPLILTVIYVAIVLIILLKGGTNELWLYAGVFLVSALLFVLFADAFSGYLQLSDDLLTRKNLFGSKTIKISEIKEVSKAQHIFGPDQIDIGNAQNRVTVVSGAFKRDEFILLVRQLHNELKPINPKRAKNLNDIIGRYEHKGL